jgi:hypothetical protein
MKVKRSARSAPRFLNVMLILILLFLTQSWRPKKTEVLAAETFQIYLGKKNVGYLKITQLTEIDKSRIEVVSEVAARFLFKYSASGRETYEYRNDTLIRSEIFRTVNERISLQQSIAKGPNGYLFKDQSSDRILTTSAIRLNLTRLFLEEPANEERVFSDRYGQWVPLLKVGEHQYEVTLPNGSRTIFTYKNRRCHSVVSIGTFYRVNLIVE